jgi:hypothetical protein
MMYHQTEPCLVEGIQTCQALNCRNKAVVYLWRVDIYEAEQLVYVCEWCADCALRRLELPKFHLSEASAFSYITSEVLCPDYQPASTA